MCLLDNLVSEMYLELGQLLVTVWFILPFEGKKKSLPKQVWSNLIETVA